MGAEENLQDIPSEVEEKNLSLEREDEAREAVSHKR